jgi:hypothetical protein
LKRLDEKNGLIRLKEAWGIFCLLGIIMLNYPFIHIFNKPHDVLLGVPLMVLYLFIGWPISIGVIYLFSCYLVTPDEPVHSAENTDEESA